MFDDILAGVQSVANGFMRTPVVIRNRAAIDKDPENPGGDDVIEYGTETVSTTGWFVNPATKGLDEQGGMNAVVSEPTLRLPVGTEVRQGAEIVIAGREYHVVGDTSVDETWPAMLKVPLARIE